MEACYRYLLVVMAAKMEHSTIGPPYLLGIGSKPPRGTENHNSKLSPPRPPYNDKRKKKQEKYFHMHYHTIAQSLAPSSGLF